jgi:hypothetical protein
MEPVVYNVDVVESLNAFAGRCVYQLLRAFIMCLFNCDIFNVIKLSQSFLFVTLKFHTCDSMVTMTPLMSL